MSNGEADFIMTVSSDLIAEVMQKYFDKLYREKVQIVDLTPANDGYSFSIAFVKPTETVKDAAQAAKEKAQRYDMYANGSESVLPTLLAENVTLPFERGQQSENGRDSKGRFTRIAKGKDHGTASKAELQGT